MIVRLSTTAIFLLFWMATSSETSEIRPAMLYGDILPLVDLQLIAKCRPMTYNELERLFLVKISFSCDLVSCVLSYILKNCRALTPELARLSCFGWPTELVRRSLECYNRLLKEAHQAWSFGRRGRLASI